MKARPVVVLLVILVFAGTVALSALNTGLIWFVTPSEDSFPVRGVDVSHHQGQIDWPTLRDQGISFAYIKATEGVSLTDPRFADNWAGARAAGVRYGAYHFFSPTVPAADQARHFIATVPRDSGALPPVLDVEYPALPSEAERAAIRAEILTWLDIVEAHYDQRPVIYTTYETYDAYIINAFDAWPLWIRSIFAPPTLLTGRVWTFWQYNPRGRLKGYSGPERFIDLSVFGDCQESFRRFGTRVD